MMVMVMVMTIGRWYEDENECPYVASRELVRLNGAPLKEARFGEHPDQRHHSEQEHDRLKVNP